MEWWIHHEAEHRNRCCSFHSGANEIQALWNRTNFPNVILAAFGNGETYVRLLLTLMNTFKWRHIFVPYDRSGLDLYVNLAKGIARIINGMTGFTCYTRPFLCADGNAAFVPLLQDFNRTSRSTIDVMEWCVEHCLKIDNFSSVLTF